MNFRSITRLGALVVFAMVASTSTAAAQGVKFGPTFAKFSSDAFDFNNRTGWEGSLFFGSRAKVLGLQGEINWIRKQADFGIEGQNIRIDYLQFPALLRLNAGTHSSGGFAFYGLAGPAVDIKLADEVEGITLDNGFESVDVSLIFGGGLEVAHFIVEGRYTKGLRRVNKSFLDFTEIKTQSFALLFGVRFK